MSRIITTPYNESIHQSSYNEKQQLFSPHHHYHQKRRQSAHELPPAPSSSALSFLVTDQKSIDEQQQDDHHGRLPLNTTMNTTPLHTTTNYGSLSSEFTYFQTALPSTTVSSPAASTISPNDDDEGLYLLWTHQLLRERGYQLSSCKVNDHDQDDDDYSVDSSITDLSINNHQQQTLTSSSNDYYHHRQPNKKSSSYTPSWLSSCFPMC